MSRTWALLTPSLLFGFLAGCSSTIDPNDRPNPDAPSAGSSSTATGGAAGKGSGGTGTGGSGATGPSTGGSSTGATGGTTGATGGSSGDSGSAGISGSPSMESCPTTELPRTPLRRLTRFEYAATVKDLLNVDTAPVSELPEDNATDGFDNRASIATVTDLHAEKFALVSEALATSAVANLAALTACDPVTTGEEACARQFAQTFGRRAYRRPISTEDEAALMVAYAAGRDGGSYAEGIEVMIRAILQSPHFLYRLETTTPPAGTGTLVPLSQFELATRLSFLIWATGPDDALLDAAQNSQLATREQVTAKAREMLASPKAKVALLNFVEQWTSVRDLQKSFSKNTGLFPQFTPAVHEGMKLELPAYLDHVIWNGDRSLRALLTTPVAFVTAPLAAIYGVPAPAGSETTPQLVNLPVNSGRAGLLTQAGVLSVLGHPDQTSPVLRGKFVRAQLLCDPPPPPGDDVDTSLPTLEEGATARQRFSAHLTAGTSCNGCHSMMDPIGLAFENFDAIGVYRTTENNQPIDASGEILDSPDPALAGAFVGIPPMAEKLGNSDQVRDCVATQMFRFAAGRLEGQADSCSLATVQESFGTAQGDVLELIVALTQSDAFWYRTPVTP